MPQLILILSVFLLLAFLAYILISGGVIIWPLFNMLAFLKVKFFPRPVRKKYGSDINTLSKNSFDKEITQEDKKIIKKLNDSIKGRKDQIKGLESSINEKKKALSSLGKLKRNKDGSINQRSNAGKEGHRIVEMISSDEYDISSLDALIANEKDSIRDIYLKPHDAWKNWSARYGRYLGNKTSIIFMVVGFPIFFFTLAIFNVLDLNNSTFKNIVDAYIYLIYVEPISAVFGIDSFKDGISSIFVSYDYAVRLGLDYEGSYSFLELGNCKSNYANAYTYCVFR